ncbi:MAG: hypothetical protein ACHREM_13755 [Polyangiales bacterium]
MTSLRCLGPVVLFLVAACGGTLGPAEVSCPPPNPGMCAPSIVCTDGFVRTGEATCVGTTWVCGQAPCGSDASTDGANDSANDTANDGASDSGCSGTVIPVCIAGHISTGCCPAGAPCVAPLPFCNLGGGLCSMGNCPSDGGCGKGSISASHYDQACAANADCVPVYEGSACGACFCPNAAINQSALAQYRSDFAALGPGGSVCSCPLIPTPVCRSGVCAAN